MLGIFRRHQKSCAHRSAGRKYRRCHCPVWVDGHLNGQEIHKSLRTRDWQKAQGIVRGWEADGEQKPEPPKPEPPKAEPAKPEPVTVEQAWERFIADMEARKLQKSTIRKFRLISRQMQDFASRRGMGLVRQIDLATLRDFRAEWKDGPLSSTKKLERLRAFYRFRSKKANGST